MPATTDYTKSQSLSYQAEGSLYRDISEVLTNIDPDKTPFLSNIPDGEDAHEMKFEWQTDHLRPPKRNQRPEYDDYTYSEAEGVARMSNYCQIFRVDGRVSDVMQKAWKTYNPKQNELARIIGKRTKELARDIEYALMANANAQAETGGSTAASWAMTGGIPYFLDENTIDVTVSGSVFTAASAHHLETGKWVYFTATTMPTNMTENTPYYIAVSTTNPSVDFEIFNSEQDAIEYVAGSTTVTPITPAGSPAGMKMLINNIVHATTPNYTLDDVNNAIQQTFMRGGDATDAWMSAKNKRRFSQLLTAVHTTNRNQTDHRVDDVVTVYETDFGMVKAQVHRDMPDDKIFLLDPSYWKLRWFDRAHVIPDEKLAKTGSFQKFVATATMGLEATQPLASVAITGIE